MISLWTRNHVSNSRKPKYYGPTPSFGGQWW
jgi:hypothetical protein